MLANVDAATIVVSVVSAVGGSTITAVIGPFTAQRAEHERLKVDARRASIDRWRKMVARHHEPFDGSDIHVSTGGSTILDDEDFPSLARFLSPATMKALEPDTPSRGVTGPMITVSIGGGRELEHGLRFVSAEIDRLEDEWKLI